MCFAATCHLCGKTTWDGCGQHVDEVMSNVPKAQRCVCDSESSSTTGSQSTQSQSTRTGFDRH